MTESRLARSVLQHHVGAGGACTVDFCIPEFIRDHLDCAGLSLPHQGRDLFLRGMVGFQAKHGVELRPLRIRSKNLGFGIANQHTGNRALQRSKAPSCWNSIADMSGPGRTRIDALTIAPSIFGFYAFNPISITSTPARS